MVAPGESRHFASPNGSTQPPQRTGLTPPCRKPGLDIPSKVTSWELKTLAPPTMGNAGPVDAGGILLFLPHAASLPVANTGPKMRSKCFVIRNPQSRELRTCLCLHNWCQYQFGVVGVARGPLRGFFRLETSLTRWPPGYYRPTLLTLCPPARVGSTVGSVLLSNQCPVAVHQHACVRTAAG